ncbi:hypothetical protein K0M31_009534 [Melipona bicolor]|uniref:Uncharacterized protein n=1 Tax=Melipona bicolor TaxID=60889 RepID=A0AA40FNA0_9HYME|nr:hypothetical protein K0M31_009534 [Melipona bicolor]
MDRSIKKNATIENRRTVLFFKYEDGGRSTSQDSQGQRTCKSKVYVQDLKGDINVTAFSMTSRWHSRGAGAEVKAVIGARTRLVNTNLHTLSTAFAASSDSYRGGTERVHRRRIRPEQFCREGSNNQAKTPRSKQTKT